MTTFATTLSCPYGPLPAPAASPARVVTSAYDPPREFADELIRDSGLQTRVGELYRENLATYLFHAIGTKKIEHLLDSGLPATLDLVRANTQKMAAARWIVKIERDLKAPYTDSEVFDRLETLDNVFHKEVIDLRNSSGGAKFRLLLNGSLCKGRMGKNSDIDAHVETADPNFYHRLLNRFVTATPHDPITFYPQPADRVGQVEERLSGPTLDLGDGAAVLGDDRFLTHFYTSVMRSKGYTVRVGSDGCPRSIDSPAEHGGRRREVKLWLEKFMELARPDQQGHAGWKMLKKWGLRTAGLMLPLPILGPAVAGWIEKAVPSSPGTP